jgi:hypothetical protein
MQTIYFHIMGPFRVLITFIKQKIVAYSIPLKWNGSIYAAICQLFNGNIVWHNIMNKATMIESRNVHNMNFPQK